MNGIRILSFLAYRLLVSIVFVAKCFTEMHHAFFFVFDKGFVRNSNFCKIILRYEKCIVDETAYV